MSLCFSGQRSCPSVPLNPTTRSDNESGIAGCQASPGQRPAAESRRARRDHGVVDLVADSRPVRFPRNYLDTLNDVYAPEFPGITTIVGISGRAFPINASDRLWEKYALGERSKIIDPLTMETVVCKCLHGRRHVRRRVAAQARARSCGSATSAHRHRPADVRMLSAVSSFLLRDKLIGSTAPSRRAAARLDYTVHATLWP